MRRCVVCRKSKPLTAFHRNRSKPGGRVYECKTCRKAQYRDSAEEESARVRAWNAEHPERHLENARRGNLRRLYGVTPEQVDATAAAQGDGCYLCGARPSNPRYRLHVDHDHETGNVRGLLCDRCNHGIAKFCDNPDLLRAAAAYLEDPPGLVDNPQGFDREHAVMVEQMHAATKGAG